jgi:hypothetical protein
MNRLELDVDPPPALFALKAGKVSRRAVRGMAKGQSESSLRWRRLSSSVHARGKYRIAEPIADRRKEKAHPSLTSETIATASDKDGHARTS